MSIKTILTGWSAPALKAETHVRKFSTTGDILSFKRCRRAYGYFGVRGFSSATATQRYFGTLVHDVLDRINRDYRQSPSKPLPGEADVKGLVAEAHNRLIRSGVRPYNAAQQQETAALLIHRFVDLIGPKFFPNVHQTEYRLERALRTHAGRDYVLDGIVDILSGAVAHALELPYSTSAGDVEIWDYKSGKMPKKGSSELRDYEFQMKVYAELYHQQTGAYPARAVLVFVGELGDDSRWRLAGGAARRFPDLFYTVHPNPADVAAAMSDFHHTVEAIEAERSANYSLQWQAPAHPVDLNTCEACELRYSCPNFSDGRRQRGEPL